MHPTTSTKLKNLLGWGLFILLLDQLTKILVDRYILEGSGFPLIRGFFDLVHYRNPGAAFGMFADLDPTLRPLVLYGVSLFAFGLLVYYLYKAPPQKKWIIPLALILSGALGNKIDRIFRGTVVDFLLVHWRDKILHFTLFGKSYSIALVWPAFNVADSAITIGVLLLLIVTLRTKPAS